MKEGFHFFMEDFYPETVAHLRHGDGSGGQRARPVGTRYALRWLQFQPRASAWHRHWCSSFLSGFQRAQPVGRRRRLLRLPVPWSPPGLLSGRFWRARAFVFLGQPHTGRRRRPWSVCHQRPKAAPAAGGEAGRGRDDPRDAGYNHLDTRHDWA